MKKIIKNLGKIQLKEKVMISDPTYEVGVWCQGVLENVLPGIYHCYLELSDEGEWGTRCSRLFIIEEDYELEESDYRFDAREQFEVGVDSAQAGIFDFKYYENNHCPKCSEKDECDWEDEIFEITTGSNKGGVIDEKGAVARSGFGDGSYDCYTAMRNGKIVGIELVFI